MNIVIVSDSTRDPELDGEIDELISSNVGLAQDLSHAW
jgi:hypothetical protein